MELVCPITRSGILLDYDFLLTEFINVEPLLDKLTIVRKNMINKTKIFYKKLKLYKMVADISGKKFLAVPRFSKIQEIMADLCRKYHKQLTLKFINRIPAGESIADKFTEESYVDIEDHQKVCVDYMMENIYTEKRVKIGIASCIFVMDTGLGKTYTSISFIEKFKEKTLIIIPNKSNISGWTESLEMYLNNLEIGQYHSNMKKDGDVVIMTIDSALGQVFTFKIPKEKQDKTIPKEQRPKEIKYSSAEYLKKFGFVIYDEIHDYATPTSIDIFSRTNARYNMGLTATPDERLDEMDEAYYKHVGKIIRAPEIPGFSDYAEDLHWNGEVEVLDYYGPAEFTEPLKNVLDTINVVEMQKQFAKDPYRTQLLVNKIIENYQNGRNIFVFSLHKDFLKNIQEKLSQIGVDADAPELDKVHQMTGGVSQEDLSKAKANAQIILITYGFGKQSVSIKRMDTLILALPVRNKMRQIVGRILRRGGDTSIVRKIIDLRDMNTSLKSQFSTRQQVYKEKGFTIKHEKILFDNITVV
jgi:superfamily II DNA or RNA helicase